MTACTCPASVSALGRFVTRHKLECPNRPAFCAGGPDRPPHVTDTVRPRKPHMVPLCDGCDLARRTRQGGRHG